MSIVSSLQNHFPNINFETMEVEHDEDLCGDIDYLGWVNDKAFGIQMKFVTIKSNLGNYSASERMKASFKSFTEKYGGVYIWFTALMIRLRIQK